MKRLHVTELTDAEFAAVFQAAAGEAVARAKLRGVTAPTLKIEKPEPRKAQRAAPVALPAGKKASA